MSVDIIKLKGKPYVQFKELLTVAHEKGLTGIKTEVLQFPTEANANTVIVKAVVTFGDKQFSGIGDASPRSVTSLIEPHMIRMAETRAVGRAFRFACDIGTVMKEELAGEHQQATEKATPKPKQEITIDRLYKGEKMVFADDTEGRDVQRKHLLSTADLTNLTPENRELYSKWLVGSIAERKKLIAEIPALENAVYPVKAAIINAHNKYLETAHLEKASWNKLRDYKIHLEKKGAEIV